MKLWHVLLVLLFASPHSLARRERLGSSLPSTARELSSTNADKPKHPPPNHSTGSSSGGGGGGGGSSGGSSSSGSSSSGGSSHSSSGGSSSGGSSSSSGGSGGSGSGGNGGSGGGGCSSSKNCDSINSQAQSGSSEHTKGILMLAAAALVAGVLIAAIAARNRQLKTTDHSLKGSLSRRMALFGSLAAQHNTDRPARRVDATDAYRPAPEGADV